MTNKSKFLKLAKLAIAGVVLTSGIAACGMSEKHKCSSKHSCSSSAKEGKESCSSTKEGKESCSSAKEEKSSCSSKHSCSSKE